MKKTVFYGAGLLLIITLLTSCGKGRLYDEWKDSVCSFGDGTYQILRQSRQSVSYETLYNCKYNQCVISELDKYIQCDNDIYFIGKYYEQDICAVLDIKSNLLRFYVKDRADFDMIYANDMLKDNQLKIIVDFNDFSEAEQHIFSELKG